MKKTSLFLLLGWFSISLSQPVSSDELLIESIEKEPKNSIDGIPRPNRGMDAARVKQVFGKPSKIYRAVGSPPISRWVYPGFIVFFESGKVINTVIKKANGLR